MPLNLVLISSIYVGPTMSLPTKAEMTRTNERPSAARHTILTTLLIDKKFEWSRSRKTSTHINILPGQTTYSNVRDSG